MDAVSMVEVEVEESQSQPHSKKRLTFSVVLASSGVSESFKPRWLLDCFRSSSPCKLHSALRSLTRIKLLSVVQRR